jgi:hypothetical protein
MCVTKVPSTRCIRGSVSELAEIQVHIIHSSKDHVIMRPAVTFIKDKFHLDCSCVCRDLHRLGNLLVLRVQRQAMVSVHFFHASKGPVCRFADIFKSLIVNLGIKFLTNGRDRWRTLFDVSQVARKLIKELQGVGRRQGLWTFTRN